MNCIDLQVEYIISRLLTLHKTLILTNYTGINYFSSTDKPEIFLFPFSFDSKGLGCLEKQLIHYHLSETHDYFFFRPKVLPIRPVAPPRW